MPEQPYLDDDRLEAQTRERLSREIDVLARTIAMLADPQRDEGAFDHRDERSQEHLLRYATTLLVALETQLGPIQFGQAFEGQLLELVRDPLQRNDDQLHHDALDLLAENSTRMAEALEHLASRP